MSKWNWSENHTAYADGTGTYEAGWYATSESGYLCGSGPEAGPFATEAEAAVAAKKLEEEQTNG